MFIFIVNNWNCGVYIKTKPIYSFVTSCVSPTGWSGCTLRSSSKFTKMAIRLKYIMMVLYLIWS